MWGAIWCGMEEGVDLVRMRAVGRWQSNGAMEDGEEVERVKGQRDFVDTTVAALAVAGAYNVVNRTGRYAATKTARMALKAGLGFGLAQDLLSALRGDPPAYVSWILARVRGGVGPEIEV